LIEFQEENPDKLQSLKHLDVFSALNDRDIDPSKLSSFLAFYTFYYGIGGSAKKLPCDVRCGVRKNHFGQIMELKFKLESLRMHFDEGEDYGYSEIVTKYLVKLSPTLKTLEITCGDPMNVFPPPEKKNFIPKTQRFRCRIRCFEFQ